MTLTLRGPHRHHAFLLFADGTTLTADGGPATLRFLGPSARPHDRYLEEGESLRASPGRAVRALLPEGSRLRIATPTARPTAYASYFCDNCFAPIARLRLDPGDPLGDLPRARAEFWGEGRDRSCPRCRAELSPYV